MFFVLVILSGCAVSPAERNDAGIALYNRGEYASALQAYQAAQVASPDQAEPYLNAASAYMQSGEMDKALAALHQALKTADVNLAAQVYYDLGNVYFEMRRFGDAVRAYEQALLLNPDDDDARHNLELALRQIIELSPTPGTESSTPPSDQGAGGETIPTPQPGTPSPPPNSQQDNASSDESPTLENTLTVEEAETLLDGIRRDQHILQEYLTTPAAHTSDKDW
jgi:Ca-activated chloride channel homolog